jgi:hypothetical protein
MNFRHVPATSDYWFERSARTMRGGAINIHVPAPKIIVPKPMACHVVAVGNPARTISEIRP